MILTKNIRCIEYQILEQVAVLNKEKKLMLIVHTRDLYVPLNIWSNLMAGNSIFKATEQ